MSRSRKKVFNCITFKYYCWHAIRDNLLAPDGRWSKTTASDCRAAEGSGDLLFGVRPHRSAQSLQAGWPRSRAIISDSRRRGTGLKSHFGPRKIAENAERGQKKCTLSAEKRARESCLFVIPPKVESASRHTCGLKPRRFLFIFRTVHMSESEARFYSSVCSR
jgi:hypothetical protein